MSRPPKKWLCFCMVPLSASWLRGQGSPAGGDEWLKKSLASTISNIRRSLANNHPNSAKDAIASDLLGYTLYLESNVIQRDLMQQLEVNRQDVQPGATNSSSGSTSLVNKGGAPWLLGFALEHGALTQTTDGNTVTFRGNVANSIRALLNSTYTGSYELGEDDPLVVSLSKLSFGVSFDTSASQPSTGQGFSPSKNSFSGFSAKYEIINHRDPRDRSHWQQWKQLTNTRGVEASNALVRLEDLIRQKQGFAQWRDTARTSIDSLGPNPTDDLIADAVRRAADSFSKTFGSDPDVRAALLQAAQNMNSYLAARKDALDNARTSSVLTMEYNYTRQLTSNNQDITSVQSNQRIPSLSNATLVLEKGFKGANAPEFTFNAGGTWFNSSDPANPKRGRVRDFRASLELDVPLKEIQNVGRPTLSFSGELLSLLEEPLGQKVTLNGVTIDRRGNVGVFQTKLSIPVKDSGVKIPVSFTYASRTELIKEKEVRGNIGITFDLDTLFAKAK